MIKQSIKRRLHKAELDDPVRDVVAAIRALKDRVAWRRRRGNGKLDRQLIRDYLASTTSAKKLHIGCGGHFVDGWLDADYMPSAKSVLHMDATREFNFDDATFDYVYSEHMIEHITYADGLKMLAECYRVLRPGGRIRIATPDLATLIDLYRDASPAIAQQYARWILDACVPEAPYPGGVFLLNNNVREWGHLFIYDEQSLHASLGSAGFEQISTQALQESPDPELCGLAREDRCPEGLLDFETITVEGVKPAA